MMIGSRIKYRREELGMSQEELAIKLGYKSRSSINKIEKDSHGLPQSKIKAIAEALNTTPSYIMGWKDLPDATIQSQPDIKEDSHSMVNKDERDLEKLLGGMIERLSDGGLMFNGVALDEETVELLIASLENDMRIAKVAAREKFTPKKYQNKK